MKANVLAINRHTKDINKIGREFGRVTDSRHSDVIFRNAEFILLQT